MKSCKNCNTNKPLDDYRKRSGAKDGRRGVCRACENGQTNKRRSTPEGRQKHNEANRESYYRNHERSKERGRANAKKYNSKPGVKERKKEYAKAYNAANLDKFRGYEAEKRALKQQLPSEKFSHEEIFERDGWVCQLCFESVPRDLTDQYHPLYPNLDHIIPLKAAIPLDENPGHVRSNVQLTHRVCNVTKKNKILS